MTTPPNDGRAVMSGDQAVLSFLADGQDYALLVTEDGTAYILCSKADSLSTHLTGEDAARFRSDYDTLRSQFPSWQSDQTLAQLWDQGGYSWLATQEAH